MLLLFRLPPAANQIAALAFFLQLLLSFYYGWLDHKMGNVKINIIKTDMVKKKVWRALQPYHRSLLSLPPSLAVLRSGTLSSSPSFVVSFIIAVCV